MKLLRDTRGFTLLELVVTSAVLLVLLIVTAVILHPHDYSGAMRDGDRQAAMAQILEAVRYYQRDHAGSLPDGIATTPKSMGSQSGELNLCSSLVPAYLKDMPLDPIASGKISKSQANITDKPCTDSDVEYTTGFTIARSNDGRHITIAAIAPEARPSLSVSY